MQNITSTDGLKNAIELLEVEQAIRGQLLQEQFYLTYESLKPINVLRRTLKELTTTSSLMDNIQAVLMGLASGYLSKMVITGRSVNIIRKVLGSILQFGVTNVVAKNSGVIKSAGRGIFQYFLNKKLMRARNRVR